LEGIKLSETRKIRIENLSESNIEDLIHVCSSKRLSDPAHVKGVEIKKRWLLDMLKRFGSVAKIAYLDDRPVAQILYYPEDSNPTSLSTRKGVLNILCIYNPIPAAQRLGIGNRLLQSVIEDAKQGKICLGNETCTFIVTKAFDTGESLCLSEFYKKHGFLKAENDELLYLPIHGTYEQNRSTGEYRPLLEDRNKALVFYSPQCQFSYQFATRISETIKEVAPEVSIELINADERPEEFLKRKGCSLIVNARPIRTFFMETEKFKEEIRQAIHKKR
jgi:GNAT superfamily N-acetyltransferase